MFRSLLAAHATVLTFGLGLFSAACGSDPPPNGSGGSSGVSGGGTSAGGTGGAGDGGDAGEEAGGQGGSSTGGSAGGGEGGAGDAGEGTTGGGAGVAGGGEAGGGAGGIAGGGTGGAAGGGTGGAAGGSTGGIAGGGQAGAGTGGIAGGGAGGVAGGGQAGGGASGAAGAGGSGGTCGINCCVKVAPDGDDDLAAGNDGQTPFRNVQPAIDFAESHHGAGTRVCVAAGPTCLGSAAFPGPDAVDLRMQNGISVFGGYESTGFTRCDPLSVTELLPNTALGVVFEPDVQSETALDGFVIRALDASTTTGVTVRGASGVRLSALTVTGDEATDWFGIDVLGADVDVSNSAIVFNGVTGEAIGLRAVGARVSLDAAITLSLDAGWAQGVRLEESPGSEVHADIEVTATSGELAGAHVFGDAAGTEITASTLRVTARSGESVGIWFEDCEGAEPLVAQSRITASGPGSVEAIRAVGNCHPRIEANDAITSVASGNATAIRCSSLMDIPSRCVIADNADIRAESEFTHLTLASGIVCAGGSCAAIVNNGVTGGVFTSLAGCHVACRTVSFGIDLEDSDALIARNVVRAGCGDISAGIRARGGFARIENNIVFGRSPDSVCGEDSVLFSAAILSEEAHIDVHSNTLDGGGSRGWVSPCASAAVAGGSGSYRNNIFRAGICYGSRYGFAESNLGIGSPPPPADPSVLENNDFDPTEVTALYLAGVAQPLTTVEAINALPGASENFSAVPMFVSYPTDLHIDASSACVNAGTVEGAPALDFDGEARDLRPDVGADERIPPGCAGVTCSGHGVCENPGSGAHCNCDSGYRQPTSEPLACEVVPNACSPNPCNPGQICTPVGESGYACGCLPGVSGNNCEITFVELAAGYDHTCGVRSNGTIGCWGSNTNGKSSPPTGTFTAITAGLEHTCALRSDDTIACFGYDADGRSSPPAGAFMAIAAAALNTCGLRLNGSAECWGDDFLGQSTPPAGQFTSLVGAGYTLCALAMNGTATCWGNDASEQGSPPAGAFDEVALSDEHGCGLRSIGTIECWGRNSEGQGGPTPPGPFQAVGVGNYYSCGLGTNGQLACWGSPSAPVSPPAGTFVSFIAAYAHGCGIRPSGEVSCWGSNSAGQSTPP